MTEAGFVAGRGGQPTAELQMRTKFGEGKLKCEPATLLAPVCVSLTLFA